MSAKKPSIPQHWTERKEFTFRPDAETWRRLTRYLREIEDRTGIAPVKNDVILEALLEWLDRREKRKR